MTERAATPLRLLVVLPSWVGDTAMATPTLRRLRTALPGIFIGALARPGIDQLLNGSDLIDEIHTFQPHGIMAPKRAASKVRGRAYDTALLLTNSFSTALIARLAFIPRRVGYSRDSRGMLLTDPVRPPRNADNSWKITPAVDYYWNLASHLLDEPEIDWSIHTPTDCRQIPLALPGDARLELPVTDKDNAAAEAILGRSGLTDSPFALLNPGGNNPAKRWPAERFAQLADHLRHRHNIGVLVNGSPAESDLCDAIAGQSSASQGHKPIASLPGLGNTLGSLKALCRRASVMITNDTGPRHIAAAAGTPLVTLFGPTDPRWTTIPVHPHLDGSPSETVLVADETLPPEASANDHPDRCRVDRITLERVIAETDEQLRRSGGPVRQPG
ncbi:MAG: lipopolysaccharide heptosyltransferase II [Planctomycetota bacterium]